MLTPRIPLAVGWIGDHTIHLVYSPGVIKWKPLSPLLRCVSSVRIGVLCLLLSPPGVFWRVFFLVFFGGNFESSFIGHRGFVPKRFNQ